jgi:hypothetical protein
MGLWKWQHNPDLNFPQPARVNNTSLTDLNEVDAWLKKRVVNLHRRKEKAA